MSNAPTIRTHEHTHDGAPAVTIWHDTDDTTSAWTAVYVPADALPDSLTIYLGSVVNPDQCLTNGREILPRFGIAPLGEDGAPLSFYDWMAPLPPAAADALRGWANRCVYARRWREQRTAQGLDPITATLDHAGVPYVVENTGGGCLAVVVETIGGVWALSANESTNPLAPPYLVGWYPGRVWQGDDASEGADISDVDVAELDHAGLIAWAAAPDADTIAAAGLDTRGAADGAVSWSHVCVGEQS